MSWTAIVLFCIIIFLVLIMYFYFFGKTMIEGVVPLKIKAGDKPYEILPTNLDSPDSVRYYYSFWVFIENNIPADIENVIFHRGKNFILVLKGRNMYILADKDANIINGIYTATPTKTKLIDIAENFQFQKWVNIIVAVDGKQIDVYLDGKLAKSVSHTSMFMGEHNDSIKIGNINTDGKITRFDYTVGNISPQQALLIYEKGSGQGNTGMDEYGVSLVLKYKDVIQSRLAIA